MSGKVLMDQQLGGGLNGQVEPGVLLHLDVDQIEMDEEVNVRPFSTSNTPTEQDERAMAELIESIQQNGQVEPVVVRFNGGDKAKLIAGGRRVTAINIINAGLSEPMKVKAVVSDSNDPYRAAFDENDKRQSMSPMDKAMNFKLVREKHGWTGAKGDKKVAEYFGVNISTVLQYKKLEGLKPEAQAKVHSGVLAMDTALVLAKASPDQQEQIIADAEVEERARIAGAGETEAEDAVNAPKGKGKANGRQAKTRTRQAKGGKSGISAATMKKVAREHGVKVARSRKLILEWVEGENGPAYTQPVRDFLTYFVKWADGDGSDKTLSAKFQAAVGKAGVSSAPSAVDKAVGKTVVAKAPGRTVTRAAKPPTTKAPTTKPKTKNKKKK